VLALTGEREEANQIARAFRLLSVDTAISRFRQALLSVALEDKAGAVSFLRLSVEEHEAELVWLGVEPRFDPIRKMSAFEALVKTVAPSFAS
jgi:hypothetical protein